MRIRSELLPWIVECTNPNGVTVGDVLEAIWDCLRVGIDKDDWTESTRDFQGRLEEVWKKRCQMAGDFDGSSAKVREKNAGIRRVDWLLWDFQWLGIKRSKGELETWDLFFRSR